MYRTLIIGLLAATMLAGCTRLVTESLPAQEVDRDFRTSTVAWNSGERVVFAYKVYQHQGRVAFCGAWAESPGGDHNQSQFNQQMIATRRAVVDGETLANDVGWFARASYQEDALPQGKANCRLTTRVWRSWYEREVRLVATRTRFSVID